MQLRGCLPVQQTDVHSAISKGKASVVLILSLLPVDVSGSECVEKDEQHYLNDCDAVRGTR